MPSKITIRESPDAQDDKPKHFKPLCQTVIEDHGEWLHGFGGLFYTAATLGSRGSPSLSLSTEPFSQLSKTSFEIGVDGKNEKFTVDPGASPSSLAAQWNAIRKRLGLSEGTRLDPRRAIFFNHGCSAESAALFLANLDGLVGGNSTNFSNAQMDFSSFRKAQIQHASFVSALLRHADLSGSTFVDCDFTRANLAGARLNGVGFGRGTILKGAILTSVDLTDAYFEPSDVTDIVLSGATGLETLRFAVPTSAMKLRKILKDNGQTTEAREVTAAIFRNNLAGEPIYSRLFSNYVQGGKLTHYGVRPWNALLALLVLIPVFALIYSFALFSSGSGGIYVIDYGDQILEKDERRRPVRLRSTPFRKRTRWDGPRHMASQAFVLVRVPLYFSLLSAFQIGFHDFTVGTWITKLQSRPYLLKPSGWVRSVAGIQALTSFYLLALWVLTYFANPFE